MVTKFARNRITIDLPDPLYEAVQAEVRARTNPIHRATVTEVLRELIATHLLDSGASVNSALRGKR